MSTVVMVARSKAFAAAEAMAQTAEDQYQALNAADAPVVLGGSLALYKNGITSRIPQDADWLWTGRSELNGHKLQRSLQKTGAEPRPDRVSSGAWMGTLAGGKADVVYPAFPLSNNDTEIIDGIPTVKKEALLGMKLYARAVSMDWKHDHDIAAILKQSNDPAADLDQAAHMVCDRSNIPPVSDPGELYEAVLDHSIRSGEIKTIGYQPYGAVSEVIEHTVGSSYDRYVKALYYDHNHVA